MFNRPGLLDLSVKNMLFRRIAAQAMPRLDGVSPYRSMAFRRNAAGAMLSLFVLAAQAQTVTGFSPASGQPGNVIAITGSGLTGATFGRI